MTVGVWTEVKIDDIRARFLSGSSDAELALRYGVSKHCLRSVRNYYGIRRGNRNARWTEDEIQRLKSMYRLFWQYDDIALALDRPKLSVKRLCCALKIKRDPRAVDVSVFDTATETWRRCGSHPDYGVSSLGRVASFQEFNFGRLIATWADRHGYHHITLSKNGKGKRVPVHVLVCEAFHGVKPDWANLVAHGDGDRANNNMENLRWATHSENQLDRKRHGTSSAKFLRMEIS